MRRRRAAQRERSRARGWGGSNSGADAADRGGERGRSSPQLPRWARSGLSVPAFLAHHRAGGLAEGPRAELIDGIVSSPARLEPREIAILAHLEGSLRAAVSGRLQEAAEDGENTAAYAALQVERFAAIRLGPSDLLRVDIALFRPAGLAAIGSSGSSGGLGGSNDPSAAVLVVEVLRGRQSHELRLPLYAAAGVRELWLVDVGRGWTEVFRSPWQHRYRSRTLWYPGEAMPVQQLGAALIEPLPRP